MLWEEELELADEALLVTAGVLVGEGPGVLVACTIRIGVADGVVVIPSPPVPGFVVGVGVCDNFADGEVVGVIVSLPDGEAIGAAVTGGVAVSVGPPGVIVAEGIGVVVTVTIGVAVGLTGCERHVISPGLSAFPQTFTTVTTHRYV